MNSLKHTIIFLIAIILINENSFPRTVSVNQETQKKCALVIGNGNYLSSILANPENDAKSMSEALTKLGFKVTEYENLTQDQMKKAIDAFGLELKSFDVGLFFYAGHGIQSSGYNYLIPVDAKLSTEKQVEYDCVQADRVLALMEGSGTKVNIVILDACRNNPFERSWTRSSTGRGLSFMSAPSGTLIAYSTAPGSTASDGSGKNSPYTSAILESIKISDITITQMFQNVGRILTERTSKQQTPWISSSLIGDFFFNPHNNLEKREDNFPIKSDEMEKNTAFETFTDPRDQQSYKIVKIGNQSWMAENLKATKLNDNTPIKNIRITKEWETASFPSYCWYENDEAKQKIQFGALYNYAVVRSNKICPIGWHVPTITEYKYLIKYLGGVKIAGGKLKNDSDLFWTKPNKDATNESFFNALPGGTRINGDFQKMGSYGYWWTSDLSRLVELIPVLRLNYNNSSINFDDVRIENKQGCSIRCIKN